MTSALIVFARAPLAGRVKTRLAAELGAGQAAIVYTRLLRHAISIAEAAAVDRRYLFAAGEEDCDYFRARLDPTLWCIRVQCRGDIGVRMAAALAGVLDDADRALLIGSDIVDSTNTDVDTALRCLLERDDVVVGPTRDGGYWLIGCNQPVDAVFNGISWSTEHVLVQTERVLARKGLRYSLLPRRRDIDTRRDLEEFERSERRSD